MQYTTESGSIPFSLQARYQAIFLKMLLSLLPELLLRVAKKATSLPYLYRS
jgi:hypothetical protein